jgi:stage II sporulation protein D
MVAAGAPGAARAQGETERLILAPSGSSTFRVQAVYPNKGVTCEAKRKKDLRARYRGRLEIVRQPDGNIALIDHLTFDEYLQGLAEVPRSWPMETLKAQVVAARSYALYQLEHPRASAATLGYDICSTDQCQVYGGLRVEQGAFGDAWVRAVTQTRGRVLLHRNRAIQAFYHSTSPGRTKRSFPGGTPLPYLASVDGQDDASPLARWTVRVPLDDLAPILAAAKDWPAGVAITSVRLSGSQVRVAGSGRTATLTKTSLRFDLNDQAPCVYPDRYPTERAPGTKLPQTVPSIDFSLSTSGGAVVLTGRGWGHGVGMSQYGAKALAERGRRHADILAYFYAGLRPRTVKEPGAIRVLVAENASVVRIGVEGSATVTTATGSTLAPGDRFEVRGGDALDVRRGIGPSLTPVLTVTVGSPVPVTVPSIGGSVPIAYTLSSPAKVSVIVKQGLTEVFRTPEVSQILGPNSVSLVLPTGTGPPAPTSPTPLSTPTPAATGTATAQPAEFGLGLSPGAYSLTLEAYDGLDRVRTNPIALTVQAPSPVARPPEAPVKSSRLIYVVIAAFAALAVVGGFLLKRRGRTPRA